MITGWGWFSKLACVVALATGCARPETRLAGFTQSPYFDEQVRTFTFDPEVTVHVNAPPAGEYDPRKPTLLVIYALPNGNTLAQTIGCRQEPGLDWHFYIQHIGAQARQLRELVRSQNLVVAYVEAGGRSWPAWRKKHEQANQRIAALVDELRAGFPAEGTQIALAAHSGGGSFLFGFIEAVEQIPDWIERIVWLDANYGYNDERGHAKKLLNWLEDPSHYLGVVAYDDRDIELDGKKVVSPTGGTYRRTQEMVQRLGHAVTLTSTDGPGRTTWKGLEGRLDLQLFKNPQNKILHTVLVEKNGFIHALTFGTADAGRAGGLMGDPTYQDWIQPGSALPGGPAAP